MAEYTKEDLKTLKDRADMMGIKYSPNISYEVLQERVNAKLEEDTEEVKKPVKNNAVEARKKATKLVRCIVYCKNPNKKDLQGEYISAGNVKIGFIKKYVLFNEPYHLPQIIVNYLKEKKYQRIWTKKVDGKEVIKNKNVKEYDIEYLDNLTEKELAEMKQRQIAKGIIDED